AALCVPPCALAPPRLTRRVCHIRCTPEAGSQTTRTSPAVLPSQRSARILHRRLIASGTHTTALLLGLTASHYSQHAATPISAGRKRSTFLSLPEKLTDTGRPLGDSATRESPGAVGREWLPAGAGCGSACRSARRSVPAGFRPHLLFPRICDTVVWAQRCQSLAVAWPASDSTHWPVPSWWCRGRR